MCVCTCACMYIYVEYMHVCTPHRLICKRIDRNQFVHISKQFLVRRGSCYCPPAAEKSCNCKQSLRPPSTLFSCRLQVNKCSYGRYVHVYAMCVNNKQAAYASVIN